MEQQDAQETADHLPPDFNLGESIDRNKFVLSTLMFLKRCRKDILEDPEK